MKMGSRISTGIAAGWLIWIFIWVFQDYQGGIEILFQPILAFINSIVFVGIAYLSGLPLRKSKLFINCIYVRFVFVIFIVCGIVLLFIPEKLGLTHEAVHPETGETVQVMNIAVSALSFFMVIFSIINWPKMFNKAEDK